MEDLNNAVLVLDESNFYEQSDLKKIMVEKITEIFTEHIKKNPFKNLFCIIHLFSDEAGSILKKVNTQLYQQLTLVKPTKAERAEYMCKLIAEHKYPKIWNNIEVNEVINLTEGFTYSHIDGLLQKYVMTV